MFRKTGFWLILGSLLVILAPAALCQTAEITGAISDSSGSVIPSAKIVVTNLDTGVSRESLSNERGNYIVTSLLPGRYQVRAEAPGFKVVRREGITLAVDQVARIDFKMEIGAVQETITVESGGVLLDAVTSTIGHVVENRQISELPLSGRNPIAFVALTTGVRVQGGFGGKAPGNSWAWGNFSVNGGLANANTVLVEGLPLDLASGNNISFIPPVDATQEFRIQTNNFSAQYGRSSGAVVNFSIKSGTNEFHGSIYEFLRNKSLDANDFFQNRAGRPKAALTYNQFGAAVGGPIRRDKTFFFANYEGYRVRSGSRSITRVPTELQRRGDFSQTLNAAGRVIAIADPLTTRRQPDGTYVRDVFAGNVIPASRIDPVAANLSEVWPLPNIGAQGFTGVNNFATFGGGSTNEDQVVTKIDHNWTDRWKIFGTYAHSYLDNVGRDPFNLITKST